MKYSSVFMNFPFMDKYEISVGISLSVLLKHISNLEICIKADPGLILKSGSLLS